VSLPEIFGLPKTGRGLAVCLQEDARRNNNEYKNTFILRSIRQK